MDIKCLCNYENEDEIMDSLPTIIYKFPVQKTSLLPAVTIDHAYFKHFIVDLEFRLPLLFVNMILYSSFISTLHFFLNIV